MGTQFKVLRKAFGLKIMMFAVVAMAFVFGGVVKVWAVTYLEAFPDANFRSYVLEQLGGGRTETDELAAEDIAALSSAFALVNVSGRGIFDLTGIEYFTSVTYLNCSFNQLTELNVPGNTNLTELFCGSNQLTELDVSNNTNLTILSCGNNQLTQLDVSNNINLTYFSCGSNQLTQLDVLNNTLLTLFYCDNNQLTLLDVSNNDNLAILHCEANQLTALNVLSNTNLTSLWCHDNYFTSPDNVVGANRISEPQTYQGDIEYEGGFVYYPQLAEQIANPAINPPINLTLDRQYTGEIDETTETAICFDAFIFPAELTGDTVSGFYIEYSLMPGALSWGEPVRMDSQILITSAMASGQAGYTNFGYKIGALTSGTVYLLRLRMVNASSGEPSSEWSEAIEFTAGRLRILYGDINRDSLVNNYDLILMIRAINFSETAELDAQALDVNGDAAFNELDLTHFLKHFAQPGVTLGPQ